MKVVQETADRARQPVLGDPFGCARLADDGRVVGGLAEQIPGAIDGYIAPPPQQAQGQGRDEGDHERRQDGPPSIHAGVNAPIPVT